MITILHTAMNQSALQCGVLSVADLGSCVWTRTAALPTGHPATCQHKKFCLDDAPATHIRSESACAGLGHAGSTALASNTDTPALGLTRAMGTH